MHFLHLNDRLVNCNNCIWVLSSYQPKNYCFSGALLPGAITFDRLFAGARFAEVDGDLLYAFAQDEATAAEIEERFALHISINRNKRPETRNRHRAGSAERVSAVNGPMCNL
jgi:hypothetical protein